MSERLATPSDNADAMTRLQEMEPLRDLAFLQQELPINFCKTAFIMNIFTF